MARKKTPAQSSFNFPQQGVSAFQKKDYEKAIFCWGHANQQRPSAALTTALAEAYFRRGLQNNYPPDIQQAAVLQPNDPRFVYHLGRLAHQQGNLTEAIAGYQKAGQTNPQWQRRVAYPLAVALLENGKQVQQTAVWPLLSPEEQTLLEQSLAVMHHQAPANEGHLWQGIMAYQNGRFSAAQNHLAQAVSHPPTQGIGHYYLGCIAAQETQWETAQHHWLKALKAGYSSPNLQANLGELYHRQAEQHLLQGHLSLALDATSKASQYKPGDKTVTELLAYLHQQFADEAAKKGEWQKAATYWKQAEKQGGSSFRLACNLALAAEKVEDHFEAAIQWREALRRRPRRPDHPDAISDEQISRLWQRAAEAYLRAEEFDEAILVYKQAVKWQPDDLALRMALADGLVNNGRLQAAENELQRILTKNSDYIPALLRMGEVVYQSYHWWQRPEGATHYWERVLTLDPQNQMARQYLADFYQEQADAHLEWQQGYHEAISLYEKALNYQPNNTEVLVSLGRCYLTAQKRKEGQTYFAQAIQHQPQNPMVYADIIISWFIASDFQAGWQTMLEAEKNIPNLGTTFYAAIAQSCAQNHHLDIAQQWIDRAIEKAPPDEPTYIILGEILSFQPGGEALAQTYLKKALEIGQSVGQAHLLLGLLAARSGEKREAENEWKTAEKIARQTGDKALAERVRQARALFTNPFGFLGRRMGGMPGLPDFLADIFDEE